MQINYTLLIAYDGLNYHGWQIQPDQKTVCGQLVNSFKSVFFTDVSLVGASRTDAGVHALGQVAQARTELNLDVEALRKAWNARLPKDINIRAIQVSPENFHPLQQVVQKTYYYHFFLDRALPFAARYGLKCLRRLDLERLNAALQIFVGTHDFRSFCTGDEQESTIRTINSIDTIYLKNFKAYRIIIIGKSFLRYMIRRIVGAALEVAMNKNFSVLEMKQILKSCDPQQELPNAQPHGLVLRKIEYSNLNWWNK